MNEIWANRLIAGTQSWDKVPEGRKEAVKKILEARAKEDVSINLDSIINAPR